MLHSFVEKQFGKDHIQSITALAQAGSNRKYFRILLQNGQSWIACENDHVAENESFLYFTAYFAERHIPVPKIHSVHADKKIYILEDLGHSSLLDLVMKDARSEAVKILYRKSLSALVNMQLSGSQFDFNRCFGAKKFDRHALLSDLNYFRYYFLDLQEILYDKTMLHEEFERLANSIDVADGTHFMFRDFQGRNIMIKNNTPVFIDYQGGMQGPLQYDVASLLWQAKAALPFEMKEELYQYYKQELSAQTSFDENTFDTAYQKILLVRLLQVLGAYGFRGLIQGRGHFISSIPYGLQNIQQWLSHYGHSVEHFPVLTDVLQKIAGEKISQQYREKKYTANSCLMVCVQSFSYKKGIPGDDSGNGGGFMFDCRGLLNPGRFEEYKKLTGRDQAVIEFLETKTKINDYLQHAKKIVDISMEDYLARGFKNLQISFGCTGGQHRSVYCADHMAKYLQEKYKVNVQLRHLIQDEKNWIN